MAHIVEVEQTIVKLRAALAALDVKFFLVYTVENPLTGEPGVKITSNSTQPGIRAILSAILRPTPEAVTLLAQSIEGSARSALGLTSKAIDAAKADGAFTQAAALLFEQLRVYYTIAGWERESTLGRPPLS